LTEEALFDIVSVSKSPKKQMKLLIKIAFLIISNALAIWAAARLVPGISFEVSFGNLVKAGALLGVVNVFVRPLAKLISFPLIILTLGLFTAIINVVMLLLVAKVFDFFVIESFWAGLWGVVVIGLVNYIISIFTKD
jgi:putative membrane protein